MARKSYTLLDGKKNSGNPSAAKEHCHLLKYCSFFPGLNSRHFSFQLFHAQMLCLSLTKGLCILACYMKSSKAGGGPRNSVHIDMHGWQCKWWEKALIYISIAVENGSITCPPWFYHTAVAQWLVHQMWHLHIVGPNLPPSLCFSFAQNWEYVHFLNIIAVESCPVFRKCSMRPARC